MSEYFGSQREIATRYGRIVRLCAHAGMPRQNPDVMQRRFYTQQIRCVNSQDRTSASITWGQNRGSRGSQFSDHKALRRLLTTTATRHYANGVDNGGMVYSRLTGRWYVG